VTIEDAAELQVKQNHEHVVRLESRPANTEGRGSLTIRDLVRNSLRMRPDRIIVGECRSGEALDMLQAMNTGHDGSMTTGHANTPRDMIRRLETMVKMSGVDIPILAIREQIAAAVHIIVQASRLTDGTRRVTSIAEVIGMGEESDQVALEEIFVFEQTGIDEDGRIIGAHRPTGIIPRCLKKFRGEGINLDEKIFNLPAGKS
jgi:pilus assembly protein CpaF